VGPSQLIPDVLEECAAAAIPGLVVLSSTENQIDLQEKIKQIAFQKGLALFGPHSFGIINTDPTIQMNASLTPHQPKPGNIAFVCQSQPVCQAVLKTAKEKGLGFSKVISLGDKDITHELDIFQALQDDPLTKVIVVYLDHISNGPDFIRIARHLTRDIPHPKPIVAIKGGRLLDEVPTDSFHVRSLTATDRVFDKVFMQAGVIRVETIEALLDVALAFSQSPLPKGNRVAVVTNTRELGNLTQDAIIRHGLRCTSSILDHGPIEGKPGGSMAERETRLQAVLKDPEVDAVVVHYAASSQPKMAELGQVVANVAHGMKLAPWSAKPFLASLMGIGEVSPDLNLLDKVGIPHFDYPEIAVRVLAELHHYQRNWVSQPKTQVPHYPAQRGAVQLLLEKAQKENRTFLPNSETLEILSAYGMPILRTKFVTSEEEALKRAKELGYPVSLKISSSAIVHKWDKGGVRLSIANAEDLSRAYRKMMATAESLVGKEKIWGMEVQEMAEKGFDIYLGAKRDPLFGPILVFGLGGAYV
ncbi:hypothetical protein BVX98_01725, partial [bacterium F11]